jgi:hypothetical protein
MSRKLILATGLLAGVLIMLSVTSSASAQVLLQPRVFVAPAMSAPVATYANVSYSSPGYYSYPAYYYSYPTYYYSNGYYSYPYRSGYYSYPTYYRNWYYPTYYRGRYYGWW